MKPFTDEQQCLHGASGPRGPADITSTKTDQTSLLLLLTCEWPSASQGKMAVVGPGSTTATSHPRNHAAFVGSQPAMTASPVNLQNLRHTTCRPSRAPGGSGNRDADQAWSSASRRPASAQGARRPSASPRRKPKRRNALPRHAATDHHQRTRLSVHADQGNTPSSSQHLQPK